MLTPEEITKAKETTLSDNFTLYELIKSDNHLDCVFYPAKEVLALLYTIAGKVLQPIRNEVGKLRINSGYRNPILNSKVGGVDNSVHQYYLNNTQLGTAADIVPLEASLEDTFHWIIDNHRVLMLKTAIIYPSRGFIHVDTRNSRPEFVAMSSPSYGKYEFYTKE